MKVGTRSHPNPSLIISPLKRIPSLTNKTSSAGSSDCTVIVDACCGVGGNTIQFAMLFDKVIAIDLDAGRLEMARHNATIYGVADRIEFIHGDLFDVLNRRTEMSPDLVFLSPPWVAPITSTKVSSVPRAHLLDNRGQELFNLARRVSKNLILFPRQSNIYTVAEMVRDEKDEGFWFGILCSWTALVKE